MDGGRDGLVFIVEVFVINKFRDRGIVVLSCIFMGEFIVF